MDQADPIPDPADEAVAVELCGGDLVRRHALTTRIWHWTNAVALVVLLMSGLMIFNAHPRLYWGEYGANADHAWLEIGARGERGYLKAGPVEITTTGVLGVWQDGAGATQRRAFPHWATIPSGYSLADARLWHLAFAWVLALALAAFMAISLANRHFQRDLTIERADCRPPKISSSQPQPAAIAGDIVSPVRIISGNRMKITPA